MKTLITTPIYYVNDRPHIGHAYTSIIADITSRILKQDRYVFYLTGTDEHGQKVQKSAEKTDKTPQIFCDEVSQVFRDLLPVCLVQNDDFIRTSEKRHVDFVQEIWKELANNGWIYKGKYSGFYSVRDEAFYQESELINGKAPTGSDVAWHEEESYFFRLSEFTKPLLEFYKMHPDFIFPKSRLNEIVSFVESGLTDLSISRTSFSWGVKVPDDEAHVVYVWLDALFNYISAVKDKNLWSGNIIHFIGKDILRFHAVYWPAFLLARRIKYGNNFTEDDYKSISNIEIVSTGWWTRDGEKMSKSVGNVVDPFEMISKYGPDKFRYFLAKEMTLGQDGDFSEGNLITLTNADLCDNFGNLVQRVLSFVFQNGGNIPSAMEHNLLHMDFTWDVYRLQESIRKIMEYSASINKFIDENVPWILRKKGEIQQMNEVLGICCVAIKNIAQVLMPVCHVACTEVLKMLSMQAITEPKILFSKIDKK